ncbi:MAG TPA: hypothetical protein VHV51_11210 [Polyangiaceae bacterium]|jgi:hypothetical protein|nr:hypothetical protein [Polyangiaceae bacterium]
MTEVDELLARLRKLEPIALDPELSRRTLDRARMRARARPRNARLASSMVFGTVVAYLGWALHFVSALYH